MSRPIAVFRIWNKFLYPEITVVVFAHSNDIYYSAAKYVISLCSSAHIRVRHCR